MNKLLKLFFFSNIFLFLSVRLVFAHEQYVLTKQQFSYGMAYKGLNVLDALNNPGNFEIALLVGIGVIILTVLCFFLMISPLGRYIGKTFPKFEPYAHLVLRISLAGSLIASAWYHSFLGPEIPASSIGISSVLVPIMFCLGVLLILGIFTRVVSTLAFFILLAATIVYKDYMLTYFNYYGEVLALMIFGSYHFSVDNKVFGVSKLIKKYKNWELLLIRVTYGISVMWPAITIKLLHPEVIVKIVNEYHLNQIHWLFPQDPLLISLGTGLAQIAVGLFIIFGFETRLASLVTFLLYLGSVLYFKEAVWPHYVLLALALYLVVMGGGKFAADTWILKHFEGKKGKKT